MGKFIDEFWHGAVSAGKHVGGVVCSGVGIPRPSGVGDVAREGVFFGVGLVAEEEHVFNEVRSAGICVWIGPLPNADG